MMNERCKADVWRQSSFRSYRCEREATKDGFCWQHHPDTVVKRKEKSEKLHREKMENSPFARLRKAKEKITELEAENKRLSTYCEAVAEVCSEDIFQDIEAEFNLRMAAETNR